MPIEFAPNVWVRLAGTPDRLAALAVRAEGASPVLTDFPAPGWSIAEQFGHLGDLEPLWLGRLDDFDAGETMLRVADLTNRATTAAGHGTHSLAELARRFATRRAELLRRTSALLPSDWERYALHPRLRIPMRLIDFMLFVAEHDDHHLAEICWLLSHSGRDVFDAI
jgi:uncharacterized damage-inducible protein DinB